MKKLWRQLAVVAFCGFIAACSAYGGTVTPDSFGGPFCLSPSFGTAACSLTNEYINGGLLFNATAVFNDPPHAWGGINGSNVVDLLAPVQVSIVIPGTTTLAVTDSVSVLAGDSAADTLLLSVYDINHILLGTAQNPGSGVVSFGVSIAGIRSFTVSTPGADTFGVRSITVGDISGSAVPEPATLLLLGCGLVPILYKRVRKSA